MALDAAAPDAVSPDAGRADALTTIAPFVEFRVDGVLVRHLGLPGLTTVSLGFGVGLRDERAATAGITHLVEHLVMSALPTPDFEHNAAVGVDDTTFTATGTPEETAQFLRGVCMALAEPDLSSLARERKVIATEAAVGGLAPSAAGLAFNLGIVGPGLSLVDPDPQRLSENQIREHLATWFRAETATLAVTGPMPENLQLPLPVAAAPEPARQPAALTRRPGPVWVPTDCPAVVVTLPLPPDARLAELMAELVQQRLLHVLRFTDGISYDVDVELTVVEDAHLAVVTLDSRPDGESEVAARAWHAVSQLAGEGPTVEELQRARRLIRRDLSSPYLMASHLTGWQLASARGTTYFEPLERAAVRDSMSVQTLREAFAHAVTRAAVLVPEDAEPFPKHHPGLSISQTSWCAAAVDLPPGTIFRPDWWARLLFRGARQTLVVTDELVAHRTPDGTVHIIGFDDVAQVLTDPDSPSDVGVVGVNRCLIPVTRDVFGRRAARQVRAALERRGLL